ncbi:MAG: GntG family PLP-dependent aldolase [Acidimicrobiales bacterium]
MSAPVILIDLYSDTSTRPTPAMRAAISTADVGDEQQREDPTVEALCTRVAAELGQSDAVFLPTGTMCNLVAVATHTTHGQTIVCDAASHIIGSESGGAAAVSGVMVDLVRSERGVFDVEDLAVALRPGSRHRPRPGLVCLEQTHNFGGGTVWPLERWDEVTALARDRGVPVHVDGARLHNAAVASGVETRRWGRDVDSIWVDFTKGLGAPFGAVLAGPVEFVARARMFKHRFGGAMRQAGLMAAGCLYALDHHVERLAEDHANAAVLHEALRGAGLDCQSPETNMVWFSPEPFGWAADEFSEALVERHGVRVSVVGERCRAVTHLDVARAEVDAAGAAIIALARDRP